MDKIEVDGKTIWYEPIDLSEYYVGDAEVTSCDGYLLDLNPTTLFNPGVLEQLKIKTRGDFKRFLKRNEDYFRDHTTRALSICIEYALGRPLHKIFEGGRIRKPNDPIIKYTTGRRSYTPFILLETLESAEEFRTHIIDRTYAGLTWRCTPLNEQVVNTWSALKNYSYRMDPDSFDFYRSTKKTIPSTMFFGVELEVSTVLSRREIQNIVTDVEPKQKEFFIFKSDASISGRYENKLELVTVPATPAYQRVEWGKFFDKLERLCHKKGVNVGDVFDMDQTCSNGIHVHLSRKAFLGERHAKRFIAMWNSWDTASNSLLQKMSGRGYEYIQSQYCKVQNEYLGKKLSHRLYRNSLRSNKSYLTAIPEDRYSVCHGSGDATVEVRLFQGIPTKDFMLQTLVFVESMFEFSKEVSLKELQTGFAPAYLKWLSNQKRFNRIEKAVK